MEISLVIVHMICIDIDLGIQIQTAYSSKVYQCKLKKSLYLTFDKLEQSAHCMSAGI